MQIYWKNETIYIRKEFNSIRIGLEHQHGSRFIVLEHQYGRPAVMWKHSIFMPPPLFIVILFLKYLFGEINCKGDRLHGEFQPGRIAQISRKRDSSFHLRKSSSVHSQEFPLESLFVAFVDMNVPPFFKNCMGEHDLCGNGTLPYLVMFSVALCFKPG